MTLPPPCFRWIWGVKGEGFVSFACRLQRASLTLTIISILFHMFTVYLMQMLTFVLNKLMIARLLQQGMAEEVMRWFDTSVGAGKWKKTRIKTTSLNCRCDCLWFSFSNSFCLATLPLRIDLWSTWLIVSMQISLPDLWISVAPYWPPGCFLRPVCCAPWSSTCCCLLIITNKPLKSLNSSFKLDNPVHTAI